MSDSAAEANEILIRSAYEAFSRGDIAGAMAAFAEDILWHVPGRGPLSRDHRGRDEVLAFFGRVNALSRGTFRVRVDDVLAKGDRVIVLCTESAERGGHSWSSPQVHVWTVKGRKATVFHQFQGDQQTEDEFWGSPESDLTADDAFYASPA
jgi:ketosteroid isomerase-like protein